MRPGAMHMPATTRSTARTASGGRRTTPSSPPSSTATAASPKADAGERDGQTAPLRAGPVPRAVPEPTHGAPPGDAGEEDAHPAGIAQGLARGGGDGEVHVREPDERGGSRPARSGRRPTRAGSGRDGVPAVRMRFWPPGADRRGPRVDERAEDEQTGGDEQRRGGRSRHEEQADEQRADDEHELDRDGVERVRGQPVLLLRQGDPPRAPHDGAERRHRESRAAASGSSTASDASAAAVSASAARKNADTRPAVRPRGAAPPGRPGARGPASRASPPRHRRR